MRNNLKSHHVKCVRLKCNDFLSIDPDEYYKVEYILLDPSCSGSGMVNRLKYGDTQTEQHKDEKRLWNLEALQRKMLLHAMSFANVKRIVYSTCSIHQEENENVVLYALKNCQDRFVLDHVHPQWTNRGICIETGFNLEYCVRTDMKQNMTNGFFIACFKRVDTEQSLNDQHELIDTQSDNKHVKRQKVS
jgi:putative methyltransferase